MKLEILHRARDASMAKSIRPVYDVNQMETVVPEVNQKKREQTSRRRGMRVRATRADSVEEERAAESGNKTVMAELKQQLDEAVRHREAAEAESLRWKREADTLRAGAPLTATYPYAATLGTSHTALPFNHVPPISPSNNGALLFPTSVQTVGGPSAVGPPLNGQCYKCGNFGHFRRDCPTKFGSAVGGNATSHPIFQARCSKRVDSYSPRRVYLSVRVRGITRDCLLDTGCEVSVVPPIMAEGCELQPVQRKLLAAN